MAWPGWGNGIVGVWYGMAGYGMIWICYKMDQNNISMCEILEL